MLQAESRPTPAFCFVGYRGLMQTSRTASRPALAMKTVEVRHPLVQHKIGLLRNAGLNTKDFRELVTELGTLLAYEATADLELTSETMAGWAGPVQVKKIAGAKITLVPILRAGLGMLPGVLALIPTARVSVVGLQRDEETLQPVPYFEKLTGRLEERDALILDPMLATRIIASSYSDLMKRWKCRKSSTPRGLFGTKRSSAEFSSPRIAQRTGSFGISASASSAWRMMTMSKCSTQ